LRRQVELRQHVGLTTYHGETHACGMFGTLRRNSKESLSLSLYKRALGQCDDIANTAVIHNSNTYQQNCETRFVSSAP
jgi:hypothetical protein